MQAYGIALRSILMQDSILITIKQMLGLEPDYTPFDTEIIALVNSALITLKQIGIGDGFLITGPDELFEEFVTDSSLVPLIKNYLYLKVRTTWDVNAINSGTLTALKEQIAELEWRIREENEKVIYEHKKLQ